MEPGANYLSANFMLYLKVIQGEPRLMEKQPKMRVTGVLSWFLCLPPGLIRGARGMIPWQQKDSSAS
jgi:hypothetical protein